MSKLAITYYHDVLRGYSNIKVHKSGVEATKHFLNHAQNYFQLPINWKTKKPKLSGRKQLEVTIGLRGYYARFLNEDEVEVYKQHGNKSWFSFETGKLIHPEVEELEE